MASEGTSYGSHTRSNTGGKTSNPQGSQMSKGSTYPIEGNSGRNMPPGLDKRGAGWPGTAAKKSSNDAPKQE